LKRLSDRFAEAAGNCTAIDELGALVAEAAAELGFDHFALLDHAGLARRRGRLFRIDNYPEDWVREMLERDYSKDDPVHLASRRSSRGFTWAELPALIRVEARHRSILDRSRRHGLGPGFTVPANVPGEPSASCSFAVRSGRALPLQRLACAELVGAHALAAARRLRGERCARQAPHLSRREVQCLRLVALGKTDWEIGRVLGVSAETARQYVKSARSAYDVVTRTQLVVHGLRDGWISFEEAIPLDWGMG
jgi:LuxR family quorum-sensing system transcriptional regulator CciR